MKHELRDREGRDELAQLFYHNDKRAIDAFHKRRSADAEEEEQDVYDVLAAEQRYMLHMDWNSPEYASLVSGIQRLKPCSGLPINWAGLKKLAVWLYGQERKAGEYWSISFVKMMASILGRHNLQVLLFRDSADPDWAAMTLLPRESARLVRKRFGRLLGELGITWCVASAVGWDSPVDVRKEIQRRLAAIVSKP